MKLIIAGTRNVDEMEADSLVSRAIHAFDLIDKITEVVTGRCRGIDMAGERWAKLKGLPQMPFPAHWAQFGTSAGPCRNREMAKYADALLAIPSDASTGTKNMIDEMRKLDKPVWVYDALLTTM